MHIDKTRRPGNSLLAFGILVAIAAGLIGFHSTTMLLSAMSLSAGAERGAALNSAPARDQSTPPLAKPSPPADTASVVPNPTGIAAAAKAKALAEMDGLKEPASEVPSRAARRQIRAPNFDLHKVY